nr:MAG TPA: hypothetical protein [Caudoviricetes sp.]
MTVATPTPQSSANFFWYPIRSFIGFFLVILVLFYIFAY